MVDVSIIMPIFNVESYLEKSIQSVINQTYKDIEIFLVNDGSSDKSGNICDYYGKLDNRITVIHQKNAGSGFARNAGLEKSSGKYIYFMDPDDYIEPNLVEDNIKIAKENDANLVVFGHFYEKLIGDKRVLIKDNIPNLNNILNKEDFKKSFIDFYNFGVYTVWNRLYKREFLESNQCRFTNQSVGQDALFNIMVFNSGIDRVIFNNKAYYHYIDRIGSAVNRYHKNRFEKQYKIASELEALMVKLRFDQESYENILSTEYFNAFYLEFKSLTMNECTLSTNDKINRMKIITEDSKVKYAMNKYYYGKEYPLSLKIILFLIKQEKYILVLSLYRIAKRAKKSL